jgi:hypothetical protein
VPQLYQGSAGGWSQLSNHEGKVQALTEYFKGIIGQPGNSTPININVLYDGRSAPSTMLTEPFTEEETKQAMIAMNRNSTPSPDSFGPGFYRVAWATVKGQIMNFMTAFPPRISSARAHQ